ncbi:hypothetical protein [Pustulibacterium marinum]|uniref:hypothetical protein n=1 Tax=Pustulibacterium marinum TaxID=1224947 RepID=UPI0015A67FFF|nr:hypothetical protein [Pustulibacterium marinum]
MKNEFLEQTPPTRDARVIGKHIFYFLIDELEKYVISEYKFLQNTFFKRIL